MTLLLLAVILAVLVTACVYACWDASTFTRRTLRAIELQQIRRDRAAEDAAWAHRTEAYAAAQAITLRRAQLMTAEALVDALTPTPAEVVA